LQKMGKKFMPKLFKKKTSGGDGSAGSANAEAANNTASTEVNEAPASSTMKSSVTTSAHSEEGADGHPSKAPSFAYRPQGNKMRADATATSNGSHSPRSRDEGLDESSKTSNRANNSDSNGSMSDDSNPRPILVPTAKPEVLRHAQSSSLSNLELDSANADRAYGRVPLLDIIELPRGGVSIDTSAVGPVQFGIPPETIKDSMNLGLDPPSVYIVPVDRFCRDMGPALGVNLAEFEFPAYFNFFVRGKRCTLIVDSVDAERNIRKVFNETLLGPAQFRNEENPLAYAEEDFAPEFPKEAIPNFYRELKHFRIMPNGKELVLETLLKFCHFETAPDMNFRDNLGAPPKRRRYGDGQEEKEMGEQQNENDGGKEERGDDKDDGGNEEGDDEDDNNGEEGGAAVAKTTQKSLTYSQIRWIGKLLCIWCRLRSVVCLPLLWVLLADLVLPKHESNMCCLHLFVARC
jgi:hypothetical protein